jgi:hypothetical protein
VLRVSAALRFWSCAGVLELRLRRWGSKEAGEARCALARSRAPLGLPNRTFFARKKEHIEATAAAHQKTTIARGGRRMLCQVLLLDVLLSSREFHVPADQPTYSQHIAESEEPRRNRKSTCWKILSSLQMIV